VEHCVAAAENKEKSKYLTAGILLVVVLVIFVISLFKAR